MQCEKKRKGFITKGPKSKSLSTGKILIAVRLDIVRQGIDIFGIVISFFGGDNLINLKDNWLFVPWMNLDERQKVGCCKCMTEWSYTASIVIINNKPRSTAFSYIMHLI